MTVAQLIEELQKLPTHHYVVMLRNCGELEADVGYADVVTVEPVGDGLVQIG